MTQVDGRSVAKEYYQRSQLDYAAAYMYLYASYNAWHRVEVGAMSDRDALRVLKRNFNIWHQYYEGESMLGMGALLEEVVSYTKSGWPVVVVDAEDWRSMVDFWYKVRCELVHGQLDISDSHSEEAVRLAYQTLSLFMGEALKPEPAIFSA